MSKNINIYIHSIFIYDLYRQRKKKTDQGLLQVEEEDEELILINQR